MGGVPSVLLLLWCRGGCSTATVAAALTFFPPCPPCYTLQKKEGSDELEMVVDELLESTASTEDVQIAMIVSGRRKIKVKKKDGDTTNGSPSPASTPPMENLTKQQKTRKPSRRRQPGRGNGRNKGGSCPASAGRSCAGCSRCSGSSHASQKPRKAKGSVIPLALHRREGARFTLIYSHGNATDIGAMHDRCVGIADALGVNVLSYDYTGYGMASGSPTEAKTYRDIEAVCTWARANVLREGEDGSGRNKGHGLILYGQSVGSGPTCFLASEERHGPFAGVVLHSPIMSGMRVLTDSRALSCLDIYPNLGRISQTRCPVMVMHGMKDEEVPWEHGKGIHEAVPEELRRRPWWVKDRGHNDICDGRRHLREYYARLKAFLKELDDPDADATSRSPSVSGRRVSNHENGGGDGCGETVRTAGEDEQGRAMTATEEAAAESQDKSSTPPKSNSATNTLSTPFFVASAPSTAVTANSSHPSGSNTPLSTDACSPEMEMVVTQIAVDRSSSGERQSEVATSGDVCEEARVLEGGGRDRTPPSVMGKSKTITSVTPVESGVGGIFAATGREVVASTG